MAKLIIFRGNELDRELELGERTVRIGRSDQNDIVLPDPAKSVSRSHAELRFEQGKFIVVDLNSQNGVWAAGRRVPQAALEPGVPIVLGSYRLVLKKELPDVPAPAGGTLLVPPPEPAPSTAATVVAPIDTAAPPPVPSVIAGPEPQLRPEPVPAPTVPATVIAPLPAVEAPKPPPKVEPPLTAQGEPQTATRPAAPPRATGKPQAPARPSATSAAPARPAGPRISRGLVLAGSGVLILVLAAAVFLTPLGSQLTRLAGRESAERPGGTSAAPEGQQAAAAAAAATDQQALPAVPPASTATSPDQPAPPSAQAAPAAAPVQAQARGEKPAVAPVRAAAPPGQAAPAGRNAAAGGRRGAATAVAAEPKPKPPDLAQMLDDARAAVTAGDPLAAIAGLVAILNVDPNHSDAQGLLVVARGAARTAAQVAVETGSKAEATGDYANAAKQYERAAQLDPESHAAQEAMRRLKARMQSEGEDAFKRGRLFEKLGRVKEAISMYEKAIQLLPPDHADAKTARELLAALKFGVQG